MIAAIFTDVEARVQEALAHSPIYALRCLQVEQVGDTLHISGRVTTFYNKQLAQEMVRALADGLQVVNLIEVDFPRPR